MVPFLLPQLPHMLFFLAYRIPKMLRYWNTAQTHFTKYNSAFPFPPIIPFRNNAILQSWPEWWCLQWPVWTLNSGSFYFWTSSSSLLQPLTSWVSKPTLEQPLPTVVRTMSKSVSASYHVVYLNLLIWGFTHAHNIYSIFILLPPIWMAHCPTPEVTFLGPKLQWSASTADCPHLSFVTQTILDSAQLDQETIENFLWKLKRSASKAKYNQ